MSMGKPMANYAAAKRVGDFVFMSGVVAVDPATRRAEAGYDPLPQEGRAGSRDPGHSPNTTTITGTVTTITRIASMTSAAARCQNPA